MKGTNLRRGPSLATALIMLISFVASAENRDLLADRPAKSQMHPETSPNGTTYFLSDAPDTSQPMSNSVTDNEAADNQSNATYSIYSITHEPPTANSRATLRTDPTASKSSVAAKASVADGPARSIPVIKSNIARAASGTKKRATSSIASTPAVARSLVRPSVEPTKSHALSRTSSYLSVVSAPTEPVAESMIDKRTSSRRHAISTDETNASDTKTVTFSETTRIDEARNLWGGFFGRARSADSTLDSIDGWAENRPSCDSHLSCVDCPNTQCKPAVRAFGEFLYLHARNVDIAYALPQNGLAVGAAPVGLTGVMDPKYEPAFRVGLARNIGHDARITGSWTWFESNSVAQTDVVGPHVINPLALFPGTFNAGYVGQRALANLDIHVQLLDVDYHALIDCQGRSWTSYLIGARYGRLEQDFRTTYFFDPPNGTTFLTTGVDFDGIGLRLGLEGERQCKPCSRLSFYGHGIVNLLAGEFRAHYTQVNTFNGTEVDSSFNEDRIVPLLEFELGVAWYSRSGRCRLSAGYTVNFWFNTVTTPEWIQGVQQSDFTSLDDTLTIDGLTAAVQWRF